MKQKTTVVIASLCTAAIVCAAAFGGYQVGQKSGGVAHRAAVVPSAQADGVVVGGVGSIAIPGFDRMTFKAGQTRQDVTLYNPEGNSCAFVVSIILPSGKEIYRSDELEPGESVNYIEIFDPLDAVIYEASTLRYSCYSLEDRQELNGADSTFTLEVLP